MTAPVQISLDQWQNRYEELAAAGATFAPYVGPLRRHERAGDYRLRHLAFDNSAAALRLWNFLLTEEERLRRRRDQGWKIVGAMKDLGTVPVMAFSLPNVVAFYPDGAWWVPCIMECSTGDLGIADRLGIDESFCPVRAMLGALCAGRTFRGRTCWSAVPGRPATIFPRSRSGWRRWALTSCGGRCRTAANPTRASWL